MLKDILSTIITSRPDTIQFAKDRKFEEAWIILLSSLRPNNIEIKDYLTKDKFDTLIVEYIWNSNDDNNRFVLTLFLDKNCQLKDNYEFILINFDLFYNYNNFIDFIDTLDNKIIGHQYLLTTPVESINMSIFNHWLSVGPVELLKDNEKYDKDVIIKKIKARSEIERSNLNYQGLFFRFNISNKHSGPYYGIKTPCCKKINDHWIVDFYLVDKWIKTFLML